MTVKEIRVQWQVAWRRGGGGDGEGGGGRRGVRRWARVVARGEVVVSRVVLGVELSWVVEVVMMGGEGREKGGEEMMVPVVTSQRDPWVEECRKRWQPQVEQK